MNLTLITIGKKMPKWVALGFQEYATRFSSPYKLTHHEIPLKHRGNNADIAAAKLQEAAQIKKYLKPTDFTVALDEKGTSLSTIALASKLEHWQTLSSQINFIIGGPDGLDKGLTDQAQFCWSLSDLTFPHPLVRVILVEQLYRAISVIKNHPYHRV